MKFNASQTFYWFKIGLLTIRRHKYDTAYIRNLCIYICNISVPCVIFNTFFVVVVVVVVWNLWKKIHQSGAKNIFSPILLNYFPIRFSQFKENKNISLGFVFSFHTYGKNVHQNQIGGIFSHFFSMNFE